MGLQTQFGALLGNVTPSASTDRNVQIAVKLSTRWRLTAVSACVYQAAFPRAGTPPTPQGFRLLAGIGTVPSNAVVTLGGDTLGPTGANVSRKILDTAGQAGQTLIYMFGALDTAPIIEAGESFFALVGQMLYSDGSVSPADADTGSIMVYGVPAEASALDVKLR